MTQRESLIEAEAGQQTEEQNSSDADTVIEDIRVNDNTVQYKEINEDEWVDYSRLRNLKGEQLDVSDDELRDAYKKLRSAVEHSYDEEVDKWKVEYDTDADDVMKSLYVPLNSPLTDDIQLCDTHEDSVDDGKLQVKEKIKKIDRPLQSLYTDNLYVDDLDNPMIEYVEVTYDSRIRTAVSKIDDTDTFFLKFLGSLSIIQFLASLIIGMTVPFLNGWFIIAMLFSLIALLISLDEGDGVLVSVSVFAISLFSLNLPVVSLILYIIYMIWRCYYPLTEDDLRNFNSTELFEAD
jgi:hypothetical protein